MISAPLVEHIVQLSSHTLEFRDLISGLLNVSYGVPILEEVTSRMPIHFFVAVRVEEC